MFFGSLAKPNGSHQEEFKIADGKQKARETTRTNVLIISRAIISKASGKYRGTCQYFVCMDIISYSHGSDKRLTQFYVYFLMFPAL